MQTQDFLVQFLAHTTAQHTPHFSAMILPHAKGYATTLPNDIVMAHQDLLNAWTKTLAHRSVWLTATPDILVAWQASRTPQWSPLGAVARSPRIARLDRALVQGIEAVLPPHLLRLAPLPQDAPLHQKLQHEVYLQATQSLHPPSDQTFWWWHNGAQSLVFAQQHPTRGLDTLPTYLGADTPYVACEGIDAWNTSPFCVEFSHDDVLIYYDVPRSFYKRLDDGQQFYTLQIEEDPNQDPIWLGFCVSGSVHVHKENVWYSKALYTKHRTSPFYLFQGSSYTMDFLPLTGPLPESWIPPYRSS